MSHFIICNSSDLTWRRLTSDREYWWNKNIDLEISTSNKSDDLTTKVETRAPTDGWCIFCALMESMESSPIKVWTNNYHQIKGRHLFISTMHWLAPALPPRTNYMIISVTNYQETPRLTANKNCHDIPGHSANTFRSSSNYQGSLQDDNSGDNSSRGQIILSRTSWMFNPNMVKVVKN